MPLRSHVLMSWLAKWFKPKSLGERGEDAAARYLKRLNYQIVGRQVDLHVGELDIVAVDNSADGGRTIVFVEVKTRASDSAGLPTEAIDELRQQRMTRAALAYLKSHGLLEHRARFDVIAITWPNEAKSPALEHIRDAFPAAGRGQFFA